MKNSIERNEEYSKSTVKVAVSQYDQDKIHLTDSYVAFYKTGEMNQQADLKVMITD